MNADKTPFYLAQPETFIKSPENWDLPFTAFCSRKEYYSTHAHVCTLRIHTRMYIAYIHADVHCVYTRGCTLRIYTQMASGEVPAAPSHLQALNAQIPVLFLFWAPYDLGLPFGDDLSQTAWSESQLLHLPALRLWPRSDLPHICKIFLICKIGTVR